MIYGCTGKFNLFPLRVDSIVFEVGELKYKEGNDVPPLEQDLASVCGITISVTCHISSNTDATDSILVSILPYSRLGNSNIRKEMTYHSLVTLQKTDVTISVTRSYIFLLYRYCVISIRYRSRTS